MEAKFSVGKSLWIPFLHKFGLHNHTNKYHKNRIVYINNIRSDTKVEPPIANNRIVTSKYTMWNFLPKNIFEQFR